MTPIEIINELKKFPEDKEFVAKLDIGNGYIDYCWYEKVPSTVKDVIKMLEKEAPDAKMLVDFEDAVTYKEVTGVEEKYWSKDKTKVNFTF
jgi:hypothetical protein